MKLNILLIHNCLQKSIFLIFCTLLFVPKPNAQAQTEIQTEDGIENPLVNQERGRNLISCNDYDAIEYNGFTLAELNATQGNLVQISQLYGSPSSINNENEIIGEVAYYYGLNLYSFREADLKRIEIKQPDWPLTVLGKAIKVGESFSELQQKFGEDLKILYQPSISSNYAISFNCTGNDGDGLLIDFSTTTNKVVEIMFFVNP